VSQQGSAGKTYISLYYNLPDSQLNRLQHIQNSLARAVVRAPKSSHFIPILNWFHNDYNHFEISHHHLHNYYTISPLLHLKKHSFLRGCRPRSSTFFVFKSKQSLFPHHRVDRSTSKWTSQISCSSVLISVMWSLCLIHTQARHFPSSPLSPSIALLFHSRLRTHLFNKSFPL